MTPSFKVLIAGAGLGGVTLAILLDRAQIDYELFESSPQVSPLETTKDEADSLSLGGAIILGPSIFPLLEQLGLLEKVNEISKPVLAIHLVQENLKRIGELDLVDHKDRTGYASRVFTRRELLSLLIDQLNPDRVHFSKQIVSFSQNKDSAEIRCADDTSYRGAILVGADGAFSRIRTCLFKQVAKKGILPRHDASLFAASPAITISEEVGTIQSKAGGHFSLVGITRPLDESRYRGLTDTDSQCDTIVGEHVTCGYSVVPGNRICWNVHVHLDETALKEQYNQILQQQQQEQDPERPLSPTPSSISSNSWASSATSASSIIPVGWEGEQKIWTLMHSSGGPLPDDYPNLKLPIGGLFRDLIDATPSHSCHGLLPNVGQGAASAMQDAVILANLLHDLPSTSPEHVVELFKEFQSDRLPFAKAQMDLSHHVNKVLLSSSSSSPPSSPVSSGHHQIPSSATSPLSSTTSPLNISGAGSWTDSWMRKLMVRYISKIYQHFGDAKTLSDRPQANFLPLVPNRGSTSPRPQRAAKVYSSTTATKH
ncbi:hypothetical protein BGZ83_007449 [Gryganskiella cystojenkinii]|nr:hypothetical protein BGZ83_007449 [Gryganskiella cystojenkinii]